MAYGSSASTHASLPSGHPHRQPRDVYDPYKAPADIEPLYEAANTILADTPDPEWWSIPDADVIAMAFPDWQTIHVLDHPPTCRCRLEAVAVLRHRYAADRWLVILGDRHQLCPGRGSTMGQFFRFRYHHMKNRAAVGTVDEVLTRIKQWHGTTSWAYTPRHVAQTILDHLYQTHPLYGADETAARSAAHHIAAIDLLGGLTLSDNDLLTRTLGTEG